MPRMQAHGKYEIILNKVQEHVMPTVQNKTILRQFSIPESQIKGYCPQRDF